MGNIGKEWQRIQFGPKSSLDKYIEFKMINCHSNWNLCSSSFGTSHQKFGTSLLSLDPGTQMCLGMTLNPMHFYAIILEQYGLKKLLKFKQIKAGLIVSALNDRNLNQIRPVKIYATFHYVLNSFSTNVKIIKCVKDQSFLQEKVKY